jgi:hypothetical protein
VFRLKILEIPSFCKQLCYLDKSLTKREMIYHLKEVEGKICKTSTGSLPGNLGINLPLESVKEDFYKIDPD